MILRREDAWGAHLPGFDAFLFHPRAANHLVRGRKRAPTQLRALLLAPDPWHPPSRGPVLIVEWKEVEQG